VKGLDAAQQPLLEIDESVRAGATLRAFESGVLDEHPREPKLRQTPLIQRAQGHVGPVVTAGDHALAQFAQRHAHDMTFLGTSRAPHLKVALRSRLSRRTMTSSSAFAPACTGTPEPLRIQELEKRGK
jgi:hypothetical protein